MDKAAWRVQYGETRLGDTGGHVVTRPFDERVQFNPPGTKSDAIAEAQRRNGFEPVDGSEKTYSRQARENDETHRPKRRHVRTRPMMFGIYREASRQEQRGRTHRIPPKRVAVIEAKTEDEALTAFAAAEQVRSRQVMGWHIAPAGRLVVTLVNGRNVHEVIYRAWGRS